MRVRGINVIDCPFDKTKISDSISKGLSKNFKNKIKKMKNPYGNGDSAKKILNTLKKIKINDKLLIKNITV